MSRQENDNISRQAAIEAMNEWDWQELYLPIHFKQLLEELPTIKFVRCGECRHFDDRHGEVCHNKRFGDGWGNYPPPCVNAEGGCSYGERRQDE